MCVYTYIYIYIYIYIYVYTHIYMHISGASTRSGLTFKTDEFPPTGGSPQPLRPRDSHRANSYYYANGACDDGWLAQVVSQTKHDFDSLTLNDGLLRVLTWKREA